MEIDIKKVADEMLKQGFTKERIENDNFDGWTGALVDILENLYGIEGEVNEEICRRD